jgi:hypothetical protein
MSTLHQIGTGGLSARGSIVFVHGLGGHPFKTWQRDNDRATFWPEWLAQDVSNVAVYSLEYPAAPSAWLGSAMELPDRAVNVSATLIADRIDELPIVFVCHSLGGLVVKQLLRLAAEQRSGHAARLLDQTEGIVFLATPNTGSDVASWMDKFRVLLLPSHATKDLMANSAYLRDLNIWYRECAPREEIATLVFAESEHTHGAAVVDPTSSDPGIAGARPIPIDAGHLDICKPESRTTTLYKSVLRFVEDRLPKAKDRVERAQKPRERRIFISYRRRTKEDSDLALWLKQELSRAGHEVFIDVAMEVGLDWSREIRNRIEWCQFLIVLLSKDSVESEMLQEEVRLAHQRRKKDDTPLILPVRVHFYDDLDYALGAILNRYQYVQWEGPSSNEKVRQQLLQVIESDIFQSAPPVQSVLSPAISGDAMQNETRIRPSSAADPRILRRRPGGAALVDDPCYIERDADRVTLQVAGDTGVTLTIKAPQQMGKTSLLVRYLEQCRKEGKSIVFVDFELFSDDELDSPSIVLSKIAGQTLRDLGIDPNLLKPIQGPTDLTFFLEDIVFKNIQGSVAIALDDVDRLINKPFRDTVFAMLRSWHGRRASHGRLGWSRLDLVLVVSTEPNFFIQDGDLSPFNVNDPIRLEHFDVTHLHQLNGIMGRLLNDDQLVKLYELVGGHPYLTRLAYYCMGPAAVQISFDDLMRRAADHNGPFGDHLRAKLSQLQSRPDLANAMANLVLRGQSPNDAAYHKLSAVGLARRREDGHILPANLLYKTFFGRLLS